MHASGASMFLFLLALLPAQAKPGAPPAPTTWMDLAAGTDLVYAVVDENKTADGAGTGSGGAGRHELRVVSLGAGADGKLRIAIINQQLPEQSFETAIVNAEIAALDQASGALQRDAEGPASMTPWSPLVGFPFPALSAAEWKAKKPVKKSAWAPVAGEACELPMTYSFGTKKDGKKQVPTLVAELDGKQPIAVKLVGIAGMVELAQGRMPKIGVSGVQPVDAAVKALRREHLLDAKGRITEVETTGTVTAADGKLVIACHNTIRETKRRVVPAAELPALVAVVEELCAIATSRDAKAARRERAAALKAQADKAGFGETIDRLIDSLTRDGLPPGLGR